MLSMANDRDCDCAVTVCCDCVLCMYAVTMCCVCVLCLCAIAVLIGATFAMLWPNSACRHYRWKGYSDCTDVELHDVPMAHVDGVDQNAYIWNKVSNFCTIWIPVSNYDSVRLLKKGSVAHTE